MFDSISKRLRDTKKSKNDKPVEKYLIFFLFASHGILKEGKQFIFLNEFSAKEKFYSRVAVESKLRSWAQLYPHMYVISIYACC